MTPIIFLTTIIIISFYITGGLSSTPTHPKLLVISYDAFRYDYFDRNLTPFMKQLKEEGTYVDYMMNIFITKTFPNHHTMATGLFAETHGVVDNNFINEKGSVITTETYETFHYSNSVLPIWTVNEKVGGGRHSGTMMWPGCSYKYQEVAPFFTQPYNHTIPWKQRIDTLMSWFTHPINPINFGVLYIEEPDFHGHFTGINNDAFNDILVQLDNITVYLHDQLDKNGLKDINIVHLSDHGMASVTIDRIINLTNYIDSKDYKFVGTSPGLHIYPNPGKEEEIYQKLKAASELTKHFSVYKKEEIPKKYHYGNNPRVGPIFVLAEVGYAFQNLLDTIEYYKNAYNITVDSKSEFGLHGYKNEAVEMHPIFFAKGPAFLPRCKLEPFDNIDLFPLFCKILELECPSVNGTVSHFDKCLRSNADEAEWMKTYQILLMGIGSTMVIMTLVGFIIFTTIKNRYSRLSHRSYYDISE